MNFRTNWLWLAACLSLVLIGLTSTLAAEEGDAAGRNKVRQLFTFENEADIDAIKVEAENADIIRVSDNRSEGENCARITFAKIKDGYGVFTLGPEAIKNWSDFDYFAMDVFSNEEMEFNFELWDQDSKNYPTRCSNEGVKVHVGKNSLLIQINRARRNSKEGLDWGQLEPKDKIAMNALKRIKIFTGTSGANPKVIWVDNVRLLQEDAAKPKLKIALPANALAFDFGSAGTTCPGFKPVTATATGDIGVKGSGIKEGGESWPDQLTGTFLIGDKIHFSAKVPNGLYKAWLSAGRVFDEKYHGSYRLKINDVTLCDESPSEAEYFGEKYYFRFLRTQFSIKPHALWNNYVSKMFPAALVDVEVKDGQVTLEAAGHFVGALILVPAAEAAEFKTMAEQIEAKRLEAFEKTYFAKPIPAPAKLPGDGDYVLWQPGTNPQGSQGRSSKKLSVVGPFTFPSEDDRKNNTITGAGALGQRVVLSLAVLPFTDLGSCTLALADLTGPGTIPQANIEGYYQNARSNGESIGEMGVVPGLTLNCEANLTQCLWLWLTVPADAKPGAYKANFTFTPATGKPATVPVQFEVYPFVLEQSLPYSFGMYGWAPNLSYLKGADREARELAVNQWARAIGFTGRSINCAKVTSVNDKDVEMTFDTSDIEMAKKCGFGTNPDQLQMVTQLGMARVICRRLMPTEPGKNAAPVDANPGIEFTAPNFKELWMKAMTKYKAFLDKQPLPFAVESVDEPREVPNPWNRNLADTCRYGDWMKEIGLRSFVTPMGDKQSSLDYTSLVDHHDIVSVHAGVVSVKMVQTTLEKNKILWFYNTGMDRFSWGFFNWRTGSKGRWEWHFCDSAGGGAHGYPGDEWYNPFTGQHGNATLAPLSANKAGLLWQSMYFQVATGINDSAYLVTLEKAIAANKAAGTNAETVAQAEAFLAALKKVIPMTPGVKGIADDSAGALVGKGAEDDAMYLAGEWQAKIAGYLKVLSAKK